jgi:hypothetical protein
MRRRRVTPVNVGELNTEVVAEQAPASAPGGTGASQPWDQLDRVREVAAELARLQERTGAEGFGD